MREIRRILKEETAIPENIDKAMEDVLSGILNSPDEKTTGALNRIYIMLEYKLKRYGIRFIKQPANKKSRLN